MDLISKSLLFLYHILIICFKFHTQYLMYNLMGYSLNEK